VGGKSTFKPQSCTKNGETPKNAVEKKESEVERKRDQEEKKAATEGGFEGGLSGRRQASLLLY